MNALLPFLNNFLLFWRETYLDETAARAGRNNHPAVVNTFHLVQGG